VIHSIAGAMDHSPGFLKLVAEVMPRVTEVDNRTAAALSQSGDAILIDVREESDCWGIPPPRIGGI